LGVQLDSTSDTVTALRVLLRRLDLVHITTSLHTAVDVVDRRASAARDAEDVVGLGPVFRGALREV